MRRIICAAAAALLIGSAAQAADLSRYTGVVRINQNGGYQIVKGLGPLLVGDLVMVDPGGLAQVTYSCGLTEVVKPGAVYTVGDDVYKCENAYTDWKTTTPSGSKVDWNTKAANRSNAAGESNYLLLGAGIGAGAAGALLLGGGGGGGILGGILGIPPASP